MLAPPSPRMLRALLYCLLVCHVIVEKFNIILIPNSLYVTHTTFPNTFSDVLLVTCVLKSDRAVPWPGSVSPTALGLCRAIGLGRCVLEPYDLDGSSGNLLASSVLSLWSSYYFGDDFIR